MSRARASWPYAFAAAVAMAFTGAAAHWARLDPAAPVVAPDLTSLAPQSFGVWRAVELAGAVLPVESDLQANESVVYRAYRDDIGRVVTLVVAYGPPLGDGVRLHRPETCYTAQGFAISDRRIGAVELSVGRTPIVQLDTSSGTRREAVSYWLREGRRFVTAEGQRQYFAFRRGVGGNADGALVRVSSAHSGPAAHALHQEFMTAFEAALTNEARRLLVGDAPGRESA